MNGEMRFGECFADGRTYGSGIISAIANVFWKTGLGNEEKFDAGLLIMRRSFGHGRMNIIMRAEAWKVREPLLLQQMAREAADQLFAGSASVHEINIIAGIIENSVIDLLNHPPESEAVERKRKLRQIERDGLIIRSNGNVLVDAR